MAEEQGTGRAGSKDGPLGGTGTDGNDRVEAQRRRRRTEVFGEVLPDTTADERTAERGDGSDDWLQRQVPPHHS